MENIPTWVKWTAGALLTMLIIVAIVSYYRYGDSTNAHAKDEQVSTQQSLILAEFGPYDSKNVTGSDVLDAVNHFSSRPSFSIHVRTGLNPTGYYPENNYKVSYNIPSAGNLVTVVDNGAAQVSRNAMEDQLQNSTFVNPYGNFIARIYKDANGEVRLIDFTQTQ